MANIDPITLETELVRQSHWEFQYRTWC